MHLSCACLRQTRTLNTPGPPRSWGPSAGSRSRWSGTASPPRSPPSAAGWTAAGAPLRRESWRQTMRSGRVRRPFLMEVRFAWGTGLTWPMADSGGWVGCRRVAGHTFFWQETCAGVCSWESAEHTSPTQMQPQKQVCVGSVRAVHLTVLIAVVCYVQALITSSSFQKKTLFASRCFLVFSCTLDLFHGRIPNALQAAHIYNHGQSDEWMRNTNTAPHSTIVVVESNSNCPCLHGLLCYVKGHQQGIHGCIEPLGILALVASFNPPQLVTQT